MTGDVVVTAVAIAELLFGVRRLPAGKRRDRLHLLVESTTGPYLREGGVLPFDGAAAGPYADVLVQRARAGLPIQTADAQIAAICLAHGAVLATRNTKDFVQTGVEVVNPWDGVPGR